MKRSALWIASLLWLAVSPVVSQETGTGIKEEADSFTVTTENLGFKILKATGHTASGSGVCAFDGIQKKDIPLERVARIQNVEGALKIAWEMPQEAPAVECEIRPQERHVSFAVKFTNNTQKEQWIEARLRFLLRLPRPCGFWDGVELSENPAESKVHNTLRGKFPLCCAYSGQTTIAIGIEPLQYFSYLETTFTPSDAKSEVRSAVRIVVDPGKAETVAFAAYAFDGDQGYASALGKYYDLFPDAFRASPAVDPRVSDNGATYTAWTGRPQPEICRRFHAGWEWCYAPFRRTGDWLGKKEYWDYQPARDFGEARKLSLEKFQEWRRDQMLNGRLCNVAMMFYVPSCVWCEERLAKEVYADSLTTDPKVKTYFDTPWVTGHDNELRMYPWGNKFGEACMADMKQIADSLDIAGFAFDTAEGGAKYRGPGVKNSPGRAWDEEGVYCDEGMAIGKMMDYVHSLKKGDRPLAVVSNPTAAPVYICAFKSDAAMFEGTPWGRHGGVAPLSLRRFLGRKTMVWWEDFLLEKVTKWESMTPEQIRDAYQGLADFVVMKSAQIGSLPTPRISLGVPRIVDQIPALVDLVHAGWEPVSAVVPDERLWIGRFGRGVDTMVSASNATPNAEEFPIVIENSCLGKCAYVFTAYDGGELRCLVEEGRTKVSLPLKSRQTAILRAQMGIYPVVPVVCKISEAVAAESVKLSAELESHRTEKVRIICRIPDGYQPDSVVVNGQKVEHIILKGKLNFDIPISGQNVLAVEFKSDTFDSPETALWGYPFVEGAKASCQIVLGDNAGDEEKYAAQRLQLYFKVYCGQAGETKADVEIPIRKASELKGDEKNLVVVDATPGEDVVKKVAGAAVRPEGRERSVKVVKDGAVLCISASTPAGVREATFRLLRVLDTKYVYYGGFPKSDAAAKAGLVGKLLE